MDSLYITGLYGGILGIYYAILSLFVVYNRITSRVSIGDGTFEILTLMNEGKKDNVMDLYKKRYSPLTKAIRSHGNFGEYVPYCLILIALLELKGLNPFYIHCSGAALIVSRITHFIGIYFFRVGPNPFRAIGAVSQISILLILSIWNVYLFVNKI